MTPQAAWTGSDAGVIRARTRDGLIAVMRAVGGFQVSFIPKADGEWNLAGTVAAGSFETLEHAADSAAAQYDVSPDQWEPAPENIIGAEPALSKVPAVEGHHIRHLGVPQHRDKFRWSTVGGVLYPQVAALPSGLLPFSFAMDLLHHATGAQSFADAAYHSTWGGLLCSLSAGALEYKGIPPEQYYRRKYPRVHPAINLGLLVLFGGSLLFRRSPGNRPNLLATILAGAGTAGLLASAWYGRESVTPRD